VDDIGGLLRDAREAQGLTLGDVQAATRINTRYLQALEDGEYELLPTTTHVRGYLRNYAHFLGLDPQPLLDRFALNRSRRAQAQVVEEPIALASQREMPPIEEHPFFEPVNMEVGGRAPREGSLIPRIVVIIALLVAIALAALRFIPMLRGEGNGPPDLAGSIQGIVGGISGDSTGQTPTPEPTLIPEAGGVITSTNRNDSTLALPTIAPTRPSLPATLETIALRLDITERAWMRVTVDGEVVFEGLVREGDGPFEWQAEDSANLLTGNAIGVFVTINDTELGKLGGRGEVVDETWTATGSS
jgi:cytoskeletal protein RodZ